jgi:branched-chain amino acid transport system substrate-binding protein
LFLISIGLAEAQPRPIVVGAVVSQSGSHAEMAADYGRALVLWQDEVNAAGGLLGRKVELRMLDDASEAVRAATLYVQLIREDKADLLIGPYGSAATMMGAAEAESARRVMINGAGPSRAVHKRSPRYVFQSAVPYNAYGVDVLEIAQAGYKKLFIVSRDDPVAQEMADATREKALKLGLDVADPEIYAPGNSDFGPQFLNAHAAQADAWIAFGEVRDAAEMVKTFKKHGYAPRFFFVRGASDPAIMKTLGQDAEFALGAREYDVRFKTPGNERFVKAFTQKYSKRPGPAAAEGYAAGTVLAAGVLRAGTLDQEKLRAALASLSTGTVLGEYKVDPLTGEQVAAKPALTQILRGRVELVWPAALQTAKPVLPYPQWGERRILK